jgi:hypothetical protein
MLPHAKWARIIVSTSFALLMMFSFTNCDNGFALKQESSETSFAALASECGPSKNLSPTTIDEAVTMINQLPKPLSVACFLSNFKKPLQVYAVDSRFSAQPSKGPENPRIFVFSGNLMVSVVPAGPSREVVEFSQISAPNTSFKGELAFPVIEKLQPSAPYSKILKEFGGTSCSICHQSELRATNITTGEAYNSLILKPDPFKRVDQETLLWFSQKCDSKADAERCRILDSIFISGKAQDVDFPDTPK